MKIIVYVVSYTTKSKNLKKSFTKFSVHRLIIALLSLFFSWPLLSPCLHQCSHHYSCCCHFGAGCTILFPPPLLLPVSVVLAINYWSIVAYLKVHVLFCYCSHCTLSLVQPLLLLSPSQCAMVLQARLLLLLAVVAVVIATGWLLLFCLLLWLLPFRLSAATAWLLPSLCPPALQCCWCHCCCCLWSTSPPSPAMADCCFFI